MTAWRRHERIGEWDGKTILFLGFERRAKIYGIKSLNGDVVYVGSTISPIEARIREHLRQVRVGSELPIHLWLAGQSHFAVECLEDVPEKSRHEAEKRWVAKYVKTALNVTDGGGGMSGHKFAGTGHAEKIGAKLRLGANCSCKTCGQLFWRKPRDIKAGNDKFCSRECYQEWQRGKPKKRAQS